MTAAAGRQCRGEVRGGDARGAQREEMPAPGDRAREDGSRRTLILEAALDILSRDGPARASMTEIARRAGLSRQGLYLHFSSKDDLTYQAARHAFEVAHANARAMLDSGRPVTERLAGALAAKYAPLHRGATSRAARFWQGYEAPVIDRIIEMSDGFDKSFIELLARALESDGIALRTDGARDASFVALATVLDATARGLTVTAHRISKKDHLELVRLAVTRLCAPSR